MFSNLGKTIHKYRLIRNLSQETLGKQLGYRNGQFVSNIENGKSSLPNSKIVLCSSVLEIDYNILVTAVLRDTHENIINECTKELNEYVIRKQRVPNFLDYI